MSYSYLVTAKVDIHKLVGTGALARDGCLHLIGTSPNGEDN